MPLTGRLSKVIQEMNIRFFSGKSIYLPYFKIPCSTYIFYSLILTSMSLLMAHLTFSFFTTKYLIDDHFIALVPFSVHFLSCFIIYFYRLDNLLKLFCTDLVNLINSGNFLSEYVMKQ